MPRVSVIMPCYNHARYVGESVATVLGQTFADLELIVVDDKSKDNSVELLREIASGDARLKLVVHEKNQGASRSRNDGLHLAKGEFVGFCDADDLWNPDKLECQIKLLTEHSDCDLTYCDSVIIDEAGRLTGERFSHEFPSPTTVSGNFFEDLCVRNFINMTSVLVRRQPLGEQLFFDEGIKWVEDWWQWIRLSHRHRFVYEPRTLAQYRVHPQSTGLTQRPGICRNRWKVARRNLQTHKDMPGRLQAVLWDQMGVELCGLGKRRQGIRFLRRALACSLTGGFTGTQFFKIGARMGLEQWRQMRA